MTKTHLLALAGLSLFALSAQADLTGALQDYVKNGNAVAAQLGTLKDNAASCGITGRFVAGRMAESINEQRQQIKTVTDAAHRGPSGRATVEEQLRKIESGNQELRSSESMIRNGLSTDNPTCKKASAAFDRLVPLSLAMPAKVKAVLREL